MVAMTILFAFVILILPVDPTGGDAESSIATTVLKKAGIIEDNSNDTTILLGGDIMLGRSVMAKSLDLKDTTYPFEKISSETKKADIFFANLENPIINDCPKTYESTLVFCGLPSMLDGAVDAGLDIVTLANNHSTNYGENGLSETQKHLEDAKIDYVGLGNMVVKEINGTKFGFLGFDFFSDQPTDSDYKLIRSSKEQVDVLIVGVHWGVEYTSEPLDIQRQWAKKMAVAGADVIVGHHPHWVQTSEALGNSVVYYSLGNLVFDQMWSENTRKGLMIRLVYRGSTLIREEHLNTYIDQWAQPVFVKQ